MPFTDDQNRALSAPLDRAAVASRKQGGRDVSYIAGWHAIAEANRIFGFDGWNRETVELRQLGEPREVNGNIRVDYSCRVRVTVNGIVRDGCGFGQGIDRDVGQAHESALKEAETDAMKRALMTFGNPFGLALYDKSQSNVAEVVNETTQRMLEAIAACDTEISLKAWLRDNAAAAKASPDRMRIEDAYGARKEQITAMDRSAA